MKKILLTTIAGLGLITFASNSPAQVITTGGSVLGRPLAITGRTAVRFEQLPPNVQQALQAQAGQGVIASVQRGNYSGTAYRVQFVQNGARRTLQYTANGAELSGDGGLITAPLVNATPIPYRQLPAAVRNAVSSQAAGGEITSVMQGTWNAPVYDALVQLPGPRYEHVVVTRSGGLLQPMAINEAAGAAAPAPQATAPVTGNEQVAGNLSFKDLGWSVQKPMLDRTGYAHIVNVQQMKLPDGRTAYRGFYTKDNQQHQITVAQDGTVVSEGLVSGGVSQ